MASWGSLPQPGGRAQSLAAQRNTLAHMPAHPSCSLPARRQGALRVMATASRPQARVVAAPPSKETMEQTSESPQTKQPGKDVQGPVILNGQVQFAIHNKCSWVINCAFTCQCTVQLEVSANNAIAFPRNFTLDSGGVCAESSCQCKRFCSTAGATAACEAVCRCAGPHTPTLSVVPLPILQTLHSLSKNRLEMINSISDYVEERVLPVLKPVSKCWQPYDMLPKPEDPDFVDQVLSQT